MSSSAKALEIVIDLFPGNFALHPQRPAVINDVFRANVLAFFARGTQKISQLLKQLDILFSQSSEIDLSAQEAAQKTKLNSVAIPLFLF